MSESPQRCVELPVHVGMSDLLRAMACRDARRVPAHIQEEAGRALAQVGETIHARCVYVVHAIGLMTSTRIELSGCPPIEGPIAGFLEPATRVAAYVLTVGDTFETKSRMLMERGDLLEGFAWDAIGSAAADLATDALTQHLLGVEASPREAVTPPFSPGYCGMGLDQQKPLFEIVRAEKIGVTLSSTMMMHPIKSVSGLLGIGPADRVIERGVPCQWCELTNCHMRR